MKKILKILVSTLLIMSLLCGCSVSDIEFALSLLEEFSSYSVPANTDVKGDLIINYISVGQADSTLVHLPGGAKMLIDAGIADSYAAIEKQLDAYSIDKIDYLIATHPHADHIGSMRKIIENYKIGEIYMPNATADTYTFEKLLLTIKNNGYTVNKTTDGMIIYEDADTKIETLAPNSDSYESLNDYSIVVKLTYKNKSFLFMGDAEKLSENEILDSGYDVSADVLKVGHHGSSTSNSKKFVSAVDPEYAVISCGIDNDYGHPHREVISLLKKLGITYYRTDTDGTVTAVCDGNNISFYTENDGGGK